MEKWLNTLDLQSAEPLGRAKHERLKDHLINEMRAGGLMPGQLLPSERQMVEALGVAHMTIRQAMACLEREGLIRRVQGKGTFVDSDVRRKLLRGQDIFALISPEMRTGFYPSLIQGFESAASDVRHQTMICITGDDVTRQSDIVLQLLDKEVGGVAIVPTVGQPTPAYQIRQLQSRGIPVVFCHRRAEGVPGPLVSLSIPDIGRMGGQALVEHGHRRVAFVCTSSAGTTGQKFKNGLCEALAAVGSGIPDELICEPPQLAVQEGIQGTWLQRREQDVWPSLQRWFSRPNPPTAIFASFDPWAEMLYMLLPRLGLRVPEDVSIIGFGGALREGALTQRITSVVVDEVETGRQAVAFLNEMRRGDRAIDDNTERVMELSLSNGETLGPAKGTSGIRNGNH